MWERPTTIKNAITRVCTYIVRFACTLWTYYNAGAGISTLQTGSKLLVSWPYLCSLAGQTLSPLRVCPTRLVPVRVAVSLVS